MAKANRYASSVEIKVVGIGTGGCNAVTRMAHGDIRGLEFIVMDTDRRALATCDAPVHIQLGRNLTKGRGTGGDPILGHKAAEESLNKITSALSGADMVFITCGMGGGTGTGAAPLVAEIARKNGSLTTAIVTKPFTSEGQARCKMAENGIAALLGEVDTVIIIPNDRLLSPDNQNVSINEAFLTADYIMQQGIRAITEVLDTTGIINLDFADIKAIMKDAGPALMSVGIGYGENRAVQAGQSALESPLLEVPITNATRILFNIVGSTNMTIHEINHAAGLIRQIADPEANIIFGVALAPAMDSSEIKITLIATGYTIDSKWFTVQSSKKTGLSSTKPNKLEGTTISPTRRPPSSRGYQLPMCLNTVSREETK